MDYLVELWNKAVGLMGTFGISDVLDIVVIAFLIYSLVKLVRETRAEQLVKGILILLIAYALSTQLRLTMVKTLLNNFFQFSVCLLYTSSKRWPTVFKRCSMVSS